MKKVIVLMILAGMLAFTACGNGGDAPAPAPPVQDTTVEAPGPDVPAVEQEADAPEWHIHPPRDMGGRVLRIGGWFDPIIPAAMIGTEPSPAVDENYFVARMMWDNARRVEELFNISFEDTIIGYDDVLPTLTSTVAAGSPFADVVMLSGWMQLSAVQGNLIQNFADVNLPESDILGGGQVYGQVITDDLGGIWAIRWNSINTGPAMIGVNLDIINAIGAQNPVDLYEAGQWTWDAALEIMRLATTGDGTRFGLACQPTDLALHFIAANDGRMVTPDLNYGFDMANTIEALEFMEQIFSERLWSYDRVSGYEMGEWARNFHSGLTEGEAALFQTVTWSIDQNDPAFEFAVVPFPVGPSNTSGGTWMTGWLDGLVVPVGTDWPLEDIVIVLEELFAWAGDEPELQFEGGDIGWLRAVYLTEEDVQRVIGAGLTSASDVGMNVNIGGEGYHWILGTFLSHFWSQEMGVLTAVETYRGPRQEMLDQMFR